MMWYKAFSIFLLLRMNINVLFQDVDLVWFKDPFPFFREEILKSKEKAKITGSDVEGFFSDDGQRSLRYAPFYANSGFYYLLGIKLYILLYLYLYLYCLNFLYCIFFYFVFYSYSLLLVSHLLFCFSITYFSFFFYHFINLTSSFHSKQ